jgi:hypothetical protein
VPNKPDRQPVSPRRLEKAHDPPLYLQEIIYARDRAELDRSLMA